MPNNLRFDTSTAKNAYNGHYASHHNKCLSENDSATYTPMTLPLQTSSCRQCNIGCSMQFNYTNPAGWSMSAALVNMAADEASAMVDATKSISCKGSDSANPLVKNNANLLRFYVDNSALRTRQDVVFNGISYQLQFIEIYSPPLHTFTDTSADSEEGDGARSPPSYDAEIVLCHSAVSKTTAGTSSNSPDNPENVPQSWVNVSVFAKQMPTFSLSQSFFYDLLTPIIASNPQFVDTSTTDSEVSCNTSAWEDCLANVNWQTPVTNGGRTPSATSGSSCPDGSRAMLLQTKSYWSPYQVLPSRKSFYTYKGEFPYAPCFYPGMSADKTPVQWVVLDNSVTINTADYNNLQALLQNVALFNVGSNYPKLPPLTDDLSSIAYNNGKMVSGNTDNDKFYVKCEKAGDLSRASSSSSSASGLTAANLSVERELSQIPGDTTTKPPPNSTSTFYTPPKSVMSTLAFCLLVGLAIFGMFAAANWSMTSGKNGLDGFGAGGSSSSSGSYSLMALMVLSLLIMYCTSLFTSSLAVGTMLASTLILVFVGLLCSGAAHYMNSFECARSGFQFGDSASGVHRSLQVIPLIGIASVLIAALVVLVILPSVHTSQHIHQNYSFYYAHGTAPDTILFIGTRANVQVNVAGLTLDYGNEYTVAKRIAEKLSSAENKYAPEPDGIPKNSLLRIPEQVWNPPPTQEQLHASRDGSTDTDKPNTKDSTNSPSSTSTTSTVVQSTALPQSLFDSPTGYAYANTHGSDRPDDSESPEQLSNTSTQTAYTKGSILQVSSRDYRKAFQRKYKDNLQGMLAVLKDYNSKMQASSADPFGTFVQAYINHTNTSSDPWFVLRRAMNPLAFETKAVKTRILNYYPDLYLYLNGLDKSELPLQQRALSPSAAV